MNVRWLPALVAALLVVSACSSSDGEATILPDPPVDSEPAPAGPEQIERQPPDRSRPCVALALNSSTEKDDLMAQLAERYNQVGSTADGRCVDISVHGVSSGLAMRSLRDGWDAALHEAPEPQAWSPTWSMWAAMLHLENPRAVDAGPWESVAQSPLTIAMPKPMAEALGWPEREFVWRDVLDLSNNPAGWAAVGRPEWGRFAIGKDNPLRSTSGMAATVAAYYAATGRDEGVTLGDLDRPDVRRFIAELELGVARYADESQKFLGQMYNADQWGETVPYVGALPKECIEDRGAEADGETVPYVSAILLQEQLVSLYNRGNPDGDWALRTQGQAPNVPLVAIHPSDGTLMMDHPIVVLASASAEQREVAEGFRAFLQEPDQQAELAAWGFRGTDGLAGESLAELISVPAGQVPAVVTPPAPEVTTAMLADWADLRKRARVLLVVDVSGSMTRRVPDGRTRLDAAKEAAVAGLDQLHPEDLVGVWGFASSPWAAGEPGPATPPFVEMLAPGGLGASRAALVDAINALTIAPAAEDDTALYYTIEEAVIYMRATLDPDRINAIVVLSDGNNDWPSAAGRTAEEQCSDMVGTIVVGSNDPPIGVFTIAYGGEADEARLAEIAEMTGGEGFDSRNPSDINEVFEKVLSNF